MIKQPNKHLPLAIIIGAGPGTGLAIAKKFAGEKFNVALIARDQKRLDDLAKEINSEGGNAFAFSMDITQKDEVVSVFNAIQQQLGSAEILIYNPASKFEIKSICDIAAEDFINSWKVSCLGGLLAAQQVLPEMIKQKRGTIIFTGATAALRGGAGLASFAVGKFSQRALAQSLAREFGPQGIHVVHVIIDGLIDTPKRLENFPDRPLETFLNPSHIAETYWQLHQQDATTWTHEIDLRPAIEKF